MKPIKKVLILDNTHPILQEILNNSGFFCVEMINKKPEEILKGHLDAVGIIVRSKIVLNEKYLKNFKKLCFVGRVGSGLENVDESYCEENNIKVYNSPEGNKQAVAEHALGMILNLFNKITISGKQIEQGNWQREINTGIELQGKTIGIIGYGNNGRALAKLLTAFNTKVMAYDKYVEVEERVNVKRATIAQIQSNADIVSFHVPLSNETKEMFSKSFIDGFKKPFYLINISRGQVVNTKALLEGIKNNKILGACLDVLEHESHDFKIQFNSQNEELRALIKSPRVILTPHIAGLTKESYRKLSEILTEKIISNH